MQAKCVTVVELVKKLVGGVATERGKGVGEGGGGGAALFT